MKGPLPLRRRSAGVARDAGLGRATATAFTTANSRPVHGSDQLAVVAAGTPTPASGGVLLRADLKSVPVALA